MPQCHSPTMLLISSKYLKYMIFTKIIFILLNLKRYPVETHEITTEDGYILTFFRI